MERARTFEFTEKPRVKILGNDKYEITFAVKGNCDVTVGLLDEQGVVVRHLGAGVLGANAPAPFQKNALKQSILWNGKDDLDAYVKEPERLRVRVGLGLKPEFDKRLGITNPKSIPGQPWGLCCDENGVYVLSCRTQGPYNYVDVHVRRFDHDGNYVRTLFPPPAQMPEEGLQGLGFVEYEAGRKDLHLPSLSDTWNCEPVGGLPHGSVLPQCCRPAVVGGRIYYITKTARSGPALLHFVRTDGSFEAEGVRGKPFSGSAMDMPCLAASPDGRWLYAAGDARVASYPTFLHAVLRRALGQDQPGSVFAGEMAKPGSDNNHFNNVFGIDCDAQGRVYVCDHDNSRLQVFTPEGKHAKTIPVERPVQVKVHPKSGALYVMHTTRVQGASVNRIAKLTSYDNPKLEFFLDCPAGMMTLDAWTPNPRIWLLGTAGTMEGLIGFGSPNVRIFEEQGETFRKIADFEEEVKAEVAQAGGPYPGGWSGTTRAGSGKMVCDPMREQAYFMNSRRFDLRSGAWLGHITLPERMTDDIAFDKKGYMHCHFNPSAQPGVGRLAVKPDGGLSECPYDYGVDGQYNRWRGILPCRDQLGAKFFQDGIGVNMRGDVAENCNIYYVPKMEDDTKAAFVEMTRPAAGESEWGGENPVTSYAGFAADIQRREKAGEAVYWIKPSPGLPLRGATIWTFNQNGELAEESAVITGGLINGVMIDEDGGLYFVNSRTRLVGGKPFLAGKGGAFGGGREAKRSDPFTGTLIKVGRRGSIRSTAAPIALDERPARPPELCQYREEAWMEGAVWLYAGASPIVQGGCSCPTQRLHTDWYKRTFVPEAYRHSIGVVDTAGNLILHIGQYGNIDSGYGPESKVPVGGDGIAFSDARMLSGTDNYLCFSDRGERIVVLKLKYHAEETVEIGTK